MSAKKRKVYRDSRMLCVATYYGDPLVGRLKKFGFRWHAADKSWRKGYTAKLQAGVEKAIAEQEAKDAEAAQQKQEARQAHDQKVRESIKLAGETYDVKDDLKAIGCFWSRVHKTWCAPDQDTAIKAREIIAANECRIEAARAKERREREQQRERQRKVRIAEVFGDTSVCSVGSIAGTRLSIQKAKGYRGKMSAASYVAEIITADPDDGFERDFCEPDDRDWGESQLYKRDRGQWTEHYKLSNGVYEVQEYAVRGYVHVHDGQIKRISAAQAAEIVSDDAE